MPKKAKSTNGKFDFDPERDSDWEDEDDVSDDDDDYDDDDYVSDSIKDNAPQKLTSLRNLNDNNPTFTMSAPAAPYSTAPVEDVVEKERLKRKINQYLCSPRFGQYLRNCNILYLSDYSYLPQAQLSELLQRIEYHISIKNTISVGAEVVLTGINIVENIGKKALPYIDGYTTELRQDEAFMDAIEELTLKHTSFTSQDPKKKVALCMVRAAARVQQKNIAN